MEKKININSIQDKYIIVIDGQEHKVVYDVDDSRVFSVHVTGCGRGARNAVLTKNTFKSLKIAQKGCEWMRTCFSGTFKAIKVSELKAFSEKGYNWLVEDIESYNWDIDWYREREKEEKSIAKQEQKLLELRAKDVLSNKHLLEIAETEDEIIITFLK